MKKFFFFLCTAFFSANLYASNEMKILVHSFRNNGAPQYSWLSAGMTDTVISDLGRIKSLTVISDSDRKNAIREAELGQTGLLGQKAVNALGEMTGANTIITGNYSVKGNSVKVTVHILPVGISGHERTFKATGTIDEIFELQDKIVYGLLGEKGKDGGTVPSITDDEKRSIDNKYKPKLSAYELYAKGWEISSKNPNGALEFYRQSIEADPEYAAPLVETGWIVGNVLGRPNDAIKYLRKAEDIMVRRKETSSDKYASMLNALGGVNISIGQSDTAIAYYLKTREMLEKLDKKNTYLYGNLLVNLGMAYQNKNKLNDALECYVQARQLFESLNLQKSVNYAVLMLNIGNLCRDGNQPDTALKYYNKSKEIFNQAPGGERYPDYAKLMLNMGMFYSNSKNDTVLGGEYYRKSEELYRAAGLNNTEPYAALMFQMGVNESLKNDKLALSYYEKGRVIYENLGISSSYNVGALSWNTAIAYQNLNNKPKAGENYRKACTIFGIIGETSLAQKADERAKKLGY